MGRRWIQKRCTIGFDSVTVSEAEIGRVRFRWYVVAAAKGTAGAEQRSKCRIKSTRRRRYCQSHWIVAEGEGWRCKGTIVGLCKWTHWTDGLCQREFIRFFSPFDSQSSLYPAMSLNSSSSTGSSSTGATPKSQEARKVRALYDFEAAEENELTFLTGEIIHVLDDSDPNWWKGYNERGEGLFPSNFVTADLNAEPEGTRHDTKSSKSVKFEDEQLREEPKAETVDIDEGKIDRLLYLLHEANPEDPSQVRTRQIILRLNLNLPTKCPSFTWHRTRKKCSFWRRK